VQSSEFMQLLMSIKQSVLHVCCMCRDAAASEAVLSSDEESDVVTASDSVQRNRLAVAGSALHSKDKCRKSLKLTSDQLVSHLLLLSYRVVF